MATIEERVSALEDAVARLSAASAPDASPPRLPGTHVEAGEADFWLLDELQRRHPDGAITYAGHAELAAGPVRWQMGVSPTLLLDADWDASAHRIAALAHPVRARLAQRVLQGAETTAELGADPDLGTTGQLHHHLRQLVAAGWLTSTGRGRYQVPPQRVVPLLAVICASRD